MLSHEQVQQFARQWVAGWNARDIDAVLSHYRDDVRMASPLIAELGHSASGVLHGKESLGRYWREAMQLFPDLHFELLQVLTGAQSFLLVYRNQAGKLAVEVFYPDTEGHIFQASAHYG